MKHDWKHIFAQPLPVNKKVMARRSEKSDLWCGTWDGIEPFFRGNLMHGDNMEKVIGILPLTHITEWKEME